MNPPRTSYHGMRERAGGFITRVRENQLEVLLMHRYKAGRGEYFVVPGGSVEHAETPEEAAQRELFEETGVQFQLGRKLYESRNPHSERVAHYFVAKWQSGEPHLQLASPEALERHHSDNRYTPTWVVAEEVCQLPLFPSVIRQRLCEDLMTGFGAQAIQLLESD